MFLPPERSTLWTGEETTAFESEFAEWCGSSQAIAMANGSLALSASYLSVGLGQGDELITTPRTFIATASSAVLLGAKPMFADVDPDSGAITADTIAPLISPRTKAISVVHLGGWPADMSAICDLARAHGIAVIEDCARSARINGQSVGSFGDVAAWVLSDKIMTTAGEGSMVNTSRPELWDAIWAFRITVKLRSCLARASIRIPLVTRALWLKLPPYRSSEHYRPHPTATSAGWTATRTRCLLLAEALSDLPVVRVPMPPQHLTHAWYKFYSFVQPQVLKDGWSRDRILSEISSLGYPALSGSCSEIYLERCFQDAGLAPADRLPVARELGETSLMFLVHPTITSEQMAVYAQVVRSVVQRACR